MNAAETQLRGKLFATLRRSFLRVFTASVVCSIAGCASSSCEPFQAAWYLVEGLPAATPSGSSPAPDASAASAASAASSPAPATSSPAIFVAVLSEGRKETPLVHVIINPGSGQLKFEATEPLRPGELRLFRVDEKLAACTLPVAVQLLCSRDGHPRTNAVSGSLPNYLHTAWLGSCELR